MAGLLASGLSAGVSLLGGLFGNKKQEKAATVAFGRQVELNEQALSFQYALNNHAYNETRLLNDRVDAFNRNILANHSTEERTENSFTGSTGSIDFARLVKDSEAAGFNPLTVLRAGGLAGYSTTNTVSSLSSTFKPARDLMTYFAPAQPSQVNHPGTAPQAQISNAWGDAANILATGILNYNPLAREREQLEMGIARAQLANIQSDTALNKYRLSIPTWTGSGVSGTTGGFGGAVRSVGGALGLPATPEVGRTSVTNPWENHWVNPNLRDAEQYETRYGELGGSVLGLVNMVGDLYHNWQANPAPGPAKQATKAATSWLAQQYNAMVDAWNAPAWNAKGMDHLKPK